MLETVENFILGLDGQQKAIVSFLHQNLTRNHDLIPKIRFKIPMYYRKSWVCYLNPIKNKGIELAFMKGHMLSNEFGFLNQKNRKMVSGIEFFDVNQINEQMVNQIIQEAIILDDLEKQS